jgi:hypothetical protein
MATWITHLRLAENLLNDGLKIDVKPFLVGNISPDAGVPNAEQTHFEPPKKLTHWHNAQGDIDAEAFYRKHIDGRTLMEHHRAFLLGYYLHLLADDHWARMIWRPKKQTPLYQKALTNMETFMHEVKHDWYGLDFLFLKTRPDFLYYTEFLHIESVLDYLDYFPARALTENLFKIQSFYRLPKFDLTRPYLYLSQPEIDAYVELTTDRIATTLREKRLMP